VHPVIRAVYPGRGAEDERNHHSEGKPFLPGFHLNLPISTIKFNSDFFVIVGLDPTIQK
jgi:hypothetical protein